MTVREAEKVLGLSGRYGRADVAVASGSKLSEWTTRHALATSVPAKNQAADMLRKIKDAQAVLSGNSPASRSSKKARAKSTAKGSPAVRQPQSTPSPYQTVPRGATTPLRAVARTPSARPTILPAMPRISGISDLPQPLKVAAAVLGLVALLFLPRGSFDARSRVAREAKAVSVGRSSAGRGRASIALTTPGPRVPLRAGKGDGYLVVKTYPAAEVLIDGRHVGYAPFRAGERVKLAVGKHVLELKNHRFAPLATTITVKSGGTQEVRYWFDNQMLRLSERR